MSDLFSQIYEHVSHGWRAICLIAMGLVVFGMLLSIGYTGSKPLATRLRRNIRRCIVSAENFDTTP